jgi:hypothetical protein
MPRPDPLGFDAAVLKLRFDDVECDDPPHLLKLGMMFGRYHIVKRLRHLIDEETYRNFLRSSALPQLPIGGDAQRGFSVDESILREIAADLGEPLPSLCAETVRRMLEDGSQHIAKLYVLARLSDDESLVRRLQKPFDDRSRQPRSRLAAEVLHRFDGELLQSGDEDDYNPKASWLFATDTMVLKENLRLQIVPGGAYSRERELLEELRHPRIVALTQTIGLGRHELMMLHRVRGETLDGRRHPQARLIVAQLAELLAWLHEHDINYLDVKPRNIIFDGQNITLCDFGMAQRGRHTMLSTLEYVPPETAREFVASSAGDVFQLGIVLHQLYTGRHPFSDGTGIAVALANLHDDPKIEPVLPQVERVLLEAMLAKDLTRRPTAAEVAARLA